MTEAFLEEDFIEADLRLGLIRILTEAGLTDPSSLSTTEAFLEENSIEADLRLGLILILTEAGLTDPSPLSVAEGVLEENFIETDFTNFFKSGPLLGAPGFGKAFAGSASFSCSFSEGPRVVACRFLGSLEDALLLALLQLDPDDGSTVPKSLADAHLRLSLLLGRTCAFVGLRSLGWTLTRLCLVFTSVATNGASGSGF